MFSFFDFHRSPTVYRTIPAPLPGSFFINTITTEVDPPDND